MGTKAPRQGVYRFKGDVTINGHPVAAGSPVLPGDAIATGPDGEMTFIKGQSAFLVRGNTRIVILHETPHDLKGEAMEVLKVLNGKVLSVLGKGRMRIETSTVVAGVRGTAVYVES
ncbi:MAG: FecR domain-containing protein, partial [Desulfosalsimonadaceae bacterium]|nr:FecR domain-containing protein [Desulfosalsimonadaceae bacterium]